MSRLLCFCMLAAQVMYQVKGATRTLPERIAVGECSSANPKSIALFPTGKQAVTEATVAELFNIYYGENFKVLVSHVAKEQYVLTQCGQTPPVDLQINLLNSALVDATYTRKHFTVPLQSAIAGGTVFAGFLEVLQVEDRILYVDQYATASCWQKAVACGGTFESSWGGNATLRQEQMNSVDAVFMDCSSSGACSNVKNQPNAVHAAATQDPSPQKSAEYIKFFGAFFNKEPEANAIYKAVKASYALASTSASSKPTVAWVSYSPAGTWNAEQFVVSVAQYKKDLVDDAGGMNFDASLVLAPGVTVSANSYTLPVSAFNNSKTNTTSHLLAALKNVNIVIDETYAIDPTAYTFDTFKANFDIPSSNSLVFMQQQKVLRIDGDMAASSKGLSWYESRVPRPDWALEGLARYIADDNAKSRKYFRNIATGESVNAISSTACSKTLPICLPAKQAGALPLLAGVQETSGAMVALPRVFIGIGLALVRIAIA